MPQYKPEDDGKVVEGKIVVYMSTAAQSKALAGRSAKAALISATAAGLLSAAARGDALCEDCEQARRELEKQRKQEEDRKRGVSARGNKS